MPEPRAPRAESHVSDPIHVLLIEPEERARSVMQTAFMREGFEVKLESSAEEAVLELHSGYQLPSVVLCEADLQGADGFAFCNQIRSDERTAGLPLILLSHQPEKYYPRLASGVGADDYLAMPTFVNDVVALVHLKAGSSSFDDVLHSSTELVPLPQMVRALLSGIRSGRIDLDRGGQITFRQGWIVDAELESLRGIDALIRILLTAEGDYEVAFSSDPVQASFEFGLQELCTKAFPQIRRWQRAVSTGVPLAAQLTLDFARLGEVLADLPHGVEDLVRLCDGIRTVRQCVVESPLPEIATLGVFTRLYGMGVLVPRDGSTPAELPGSWPPVAAIREKPGDPLRPDRRAHAGRNGWRPTGDELRSDSQSEELRFAMASRPRVFRPAESEMPERLRQGGMLAAQPISSDPVVSAPIQLTQVVEPASEATVRDSIGLTHPEVAAAELSDAEAGFFQEDSAEPGRQPLWLHPTARAVIAVAGVVLVSSGAAWVVAKGSGRGVATAAQTASMASKPPAAPAPPREIRMDPVPVAAEPASALLEEGLKLYNEGKPAEAARVLARAVQIEPSTAGWLMLGVARFDSGDNRGAQDAAAKSLELDPRNGRAMILRATIYLDANQREKAAEELKHYLRVEPNGPYAEEAKQLLSTW